MAWQTEPTATAPQAAPDDDDDPERDRLLMEWQHAASQLEIAKGIELNIRNQILALYFKGKPEGTHNLDLPNGWKLKANLKTNYSLDKDQAKLDAALEQLAKVGNEGQFIVDRLVSWKPELSVKEYKLLGNQYKTIIDKVLTTKPGQGSIEIVAPK